MVGSTFSRIICARLESLAMSETLHVEAHTTGTTRDSTHRSIKISGRQIGLLGLGNLFELLAGHAAHLVLVRLARTGLDTCYLFQQYRSWRRLGNKGEATVGVDSDHHRCGQPCLNILSRCVERLAELHDINTVLTQRRAHGGARVGFTGCDLQLDVSLNFLGHDGLQLGSSASRLPGMSS